MVLMSPSPSTRWSFGKSFFAKEVLEWESEIVLPISLSTQAWVLVPEVVGFMFEGMRGMANEVQVLSVGCRCVSGRLGGREEVENWNWYKLRTVSCFGSTKETQVQSE